jgi:hypothetical protein
MAGLKLQPFIKTSLLNLICNIIGNGIQQPDGVLVNVRIIHPDISRKSRFIFKRYCKQAVSPAPLQELIFTGICVL